MILQEKYYVPLQQKGIANIVNWIVIHSAIDDVLIKNSYTPAFWPTPTESSEVAQEFELTTFENDFIEMLNDEVNSPIFEFGKGRCTC